MRHTADSIVDQKRLVVVQGHRDDFFFLSPVDRHNPMICQRTDLFFVIIIHLINFVFVFVLFLFFTENKAVFFNLFLDLPAQLCLVADSLSQDILCPLQRFLHCRDLIVQIFFSLKRRIARPRTESDPIRQRRQPLGCGIRRAGFAFLLIWSVNIVNLRKLGAG